MDTIRNPRSKEMPHLHALGFKILRVVRIGFAPDRHLLDHLHAVAFEADDFLGIVGQETELAHAEVEENLRAESVIAQVAPETELRVRLHRIEASLLQFVS